jgi:hypothetical protein
VKIEVACFQCKKVHVFDDIVSFRAECDACSADLHVCLTCRFWDRYVENECREDQADPVAKKDRSNLCEYWKPIAIGAAPDEESARAKARLEALFGGPRGSPSAAPQAGPQAAPSSAADEAKRKLEELFKKK